jgi:hypothetical protein
VVMGAAVDGVFTAVELVDGVTNAAGAILGC